MGRRRSGFCGSVIVFVDILSRFMGSQTDSPLSVPVFIVFDRDRPSPVRGGMCRLLSPWARYAGNSSPPRFPNLGLTCNMIVFSARGARFPTPKTRTHFSAKGRGQRVQKRTALDTPFGWRVGSEARPLGANLRRTGRVVTRSTG